MRKSPDFAAPPGQQRFNEAVLFLFGLSPIEGIDVNCCKQLGVFRVDPVPLSGLVWSSLHNRIDIVSSWPSELAPELMARAGSSKLALVQIT